MKKIKILCPILLFVVFSCFEVPQLETYNIIFYYLNDNGEYEQDFSYYDLSPGEELIVPFPQRTVENSNFLGWSFNQSTLNLDYFFGETIVINSQDLSFFPIWEEKEKYTVTYYENGATFGSLEQSTFEYYEDTVVSVISGDSLKLNNRPFRGWSESISSDSLISVFTITEDISFYAQYHENFIEAYHNGNLVAESYSSPNYYYYVGDPGKISVRSDGLRVDFYPANMDTIDIVYISSHWADLESKWTFSYFYHPPVLDGQISASTINVVEYDYQGRIIYDFDISVDGTGLTEGEVMRFVGRVNLLSDL